MRDYKQNEQLVRNLGSRYYQVIYPIQVGGGGGRSSSGGGGDHAGVSTRDAQEGGPDQYGQVSLCKPCSKRNNEPISKNKQALKERMHVLYRSLEC